MRKHVGMHVTALWAKGSDFFLFSFVEYFKCLLLFTLCFSGAYSRRNSIALPSLIVAAQRQRERMNSSSWISLCAREITANDV
jgi:hypothetical protein